MASSALWGKLRPLRPPAGAVHMEEMARLLTVTVQHWCAFFHLNVSTTGGAGLTHTSCGQGPSELLLYRKLYANAKRRYNSTYLRFGPQFQVPPGDTEGIYRDGTD